MSKHPKDFSVGIDVGGTHLRAVLVGSDGKVHASSHQKIVARDPQGLLHTIAAAVEALQPGKTEFPIGLGIAGPVHTRTGVVAVAPNLGWRNVAFGSMLLAHYGRPVRLVNDLNAITVGEGMYGAGGGAKHVLCVFVGTGVGMGAVSHGQLVEGWDGLATELGHIKVNFTPDARLCGCGERGCLEAHSSGRHLPEMLQSVIARGVACGLGQSDSPLTKAVAADSIEAAAQAGDPACLALWDEIGETLGRAIGNTVTLFNSEVLILGGGVLTSAPSLKARVVRGIHAYAARPALASLRIADTVLGEQAGAIGAAMLAREL